MTESNEQNDIRKYALLILGAVGLFVFKRKMERTGHGMDMAGMYAVFSKEN